MTGPDIADARRRLRAGRLDALAQTGAERQTPAAPAAPPDPHAGPVPPTPDPCDRPAPLVMPGVVEVPAAQLAELRAMADAPERIAAQRAQSERNGHVRAAVARGAITPHQGRSWAAALARVPESAADLAAIPDGHAGMPLAEIGYSGGLDEGPDLLAHLFPNS